MKQWIPLAISNQIRYFCSFRSKAEKHRHLCLYICVLPCFMAISAWIYRYSVDSDEAMKRLTLHRYNFFSALNISSLLLFMEKHHLTLHRCYFLKEIHHLTLHRRYFLKKLCPPLGQTRMRLLSSNMSFYQCLVPIFSLEPHSTFQFYMNLNPDVQSPRLNFLLTSTTGKSLVLALVPYLWITGGHICKEFKEHVSRDFSGPFLACMDRYRSVWYPLTVFNFFCWASDFIFIFKV